MVYMTQIMAGLLICCLGSMLAAAEEGDCRFDEDQCSCKIGEESQGTCWDLIDGTAQNGTCQSRYCRSGWTCSCAGRTHVCNMKVSTRNVVNDQSAIGSTQACHQEPAMRAGNGDYLELGFWKPSISRKGLLANQCTQLVWWLNGEEIGVYLEPPIVTEDNVDAEMERRTNHTKFELKRGDLIAFRFREGSYYCYNSLSVLSVNGTELDTTNESVTTHFARAFSTDWYKPSFIPTYSTEANSSEFTDFLPLRNSTLSNEVIVPGDDIWVAPDGSVDHRLSNFYYRIQL